MDIPFLFENKNQDDILNFLQLNAFGLLVSQGTSHPEASHLPYSLELKEDQLFLYSHMGATNRHRHFLDQAAEHLFIVQGVDHYISSTWYDHENVPTWNYISVHLRGSIKIQQGDEALDNIKRLMDRLERPGTSSRSLDSLDPDMIDREMRGLVAFRMEVKKIEAARKLSQNRDQKNYENVIRELEALDYDTARDMANEMKNNFPF